MTATTQRTVIVLGAGADIGGELARRYARDGWRVVGSFRDDAHVADLAGIDGVSLLPCDVADDKSVGAFVEGIGAAGHVWDLVISSIGAMEPIGPFFETDFDRWQDSVGINFLAQMRLVHALYPLRNPDAPAHLALFAGGGTNNPFTNYSAYCVSKIALIKMAELLDDEAKDLNVFIIGPGYVATKIHRQTLDAKSRAGDNYQKTLDFMNSPGTTFDDIYDHINWCMRQGRAVAGGRNFSTVNDAWRDGGAALATGLASDPGRFKLRRSN